MAQSLKAEASEASRRVRVPSVDFESIENCPETEIYCAPVDAVDPICNRSRGQPSDSFYVDRKTRKQRNTKSKDKQLDFDSLNKEGQKRPKPSSRRKGKVRFSNFQYHF
jgi:hypothetical protein